MVHTKAKREYIIWSMDEQYAILSFWYKYYFKRWQTFELDKDERELAHLAANACAFLAYEGCA